LFAGIGGLELGLEWTGGFETVWQVECDPYAQAVLKKHWPDVGRWDDVRTFPPTPEEDWRCDVVCGGFPRQDISNAGKRVGIEGERSGLWNEYARIIGILRPPYIIVENVPELVIRGIDVVLGALADLGYDAEWQPLPAAAFGAPHIRERVFIVAYAQGCNGGRIKRRKKPEGGHTRLHRNAVRHDGQTRIYKPGGDGSIVRKDGWGTDQPGVDRARYGVPARVDRLRCLGNAVVPQVAQWIGERILEAEL
jgi:DNA (cytosine-5)-methyltransferase 1